MQLYLAGRATPDMIATKWVLEHRGYRVVCSADVVSKKYRHNCGQQPTALEAARSQTWEMLDADLVVASDEMDAAELHDLVNMGRYAGFRVARYEELPVTAPILRDVPALIDRLDLAFPLLQPEPKPWHLRLLAAVDELANRFNRRFGWFFRNGNKPAPRPYVLNTKPLTTA